VFFCIIRFMYKLKIMYLFIIINILIFTPFLVLAEEVRDITFPVGPDWDYHFSDTYGAARSGSRSHIGTDIMTDQMAPLVAAVDGRVSYLVDKDDGWGLAIYIEDSDGYSYRYLHVNNDTPGTDDGKEIRFYAFPKNIVRGSQVKAGDLIAFAGDSGNAEWVAHHLHFELWTPSKQAINAYPSLMAAIGKPVEPATETPTSAYQFDRDLKLEDEGEDIRELQKYLNQKGFVVAGSGAGSPGNETTYFGYATRYALIKFQKAKNISPSSGYFGPITRAAINGDNIEVVSEIDDTITDGVVTAGWLVKDKVLPRVYHVDANLELRWIKNEEAAVRNFGEDWYVDIKEFDDLEALGMRFGDYIF
jgi:hypothetical protein